MKVFISWSGQRSKLVAAALRQWIPEVIQEVNPWMSSLDLEAGSRWGMEIAEGLKSTDLGIICLTPENLQMPWILFEAGALSKTVDSSRVCPYLFDLKLSQITGPLSQFQANLATQEGTLSIIRLLNSELGEKSLPDNRLENQFSRCWPELDKIYQAIPPLTEESLPPRSESEMLAEILELIRQQSRILSNSKLEEFLGILQVDSGQISLNSSKPFAINAPIIKLN